MKVTLDCQTGLSYSITGTILQVCELFLPAATHHRRHLRRSAELSSEREAQPAPGEPETVAFSTHPASLRLFEKHSAQCVPCSCSYLRHPCCPEGRVLCAHRRPRVLFCRLSQFLPPPIQHPPSKKTQLINTRPNTAAQFAVYSGVRHYSPQHRTPRTHKYIETGTSYRLSHILDTIFWMEAFCN
jgi:hypothetical protein